MGFPNGRKGVLNQPLRWTFYQTKKKLAIFMTSLKVGKNRSKVLNSRGHLADA